MTRLRGRPSSAAGHAHPGLRRRFPTAARSPPPARWQNSGSMACGGRWATFPARGHAEGGRPSTGRPIVIGGAARGRAGRGRGGTRLVSYNPSVRGARKMYTRWRSHAFAARGRELPARDESWPGATDGRDEFRSEVRSGTNRCGCSKTARGFYSADGRLPAAGRNEHRNVAFDEQFCWRSRPDNARRWPYKSAGTRRGNCPSSRWPSVWQRSRRGAGARPRVSGRLLHPSIGPKLPPTWRLA